MISETTLRSYSQNGRFLRTAPAAPVLRSHRVTRPWSAGCGCTADQIAAADAAQHPATALEEAETDLACLWLVPDSRRWNEVHFCHRCGEDTRYGEKWS